MAASTNEYRENRLEVGGSAILQRSPHPVERYGTTPMTHMTFSFVVYKVIVIL